MFDQFTDTQAFADAVKRIVLLDENAPSEQQESALEAIHAFEKFDWDADVMEGAANAMNVSGFSLEADQLVYDQPDGAAVVMDVLLNQYMKKMQGLDSPEYTMKEAAVYLGISIPELEDYVFQQQIIQPLRRGDALVFGRELLEAFAVPETSRARQSKFEG
jgi:hypothetical protein